MEQNCIRLPENWKFEEGKSYKVTYRRTEWRFTWLSDCELYKKEMFTVKHLKSMAYVVPKDVPHHIDYILADAEEKGKIIEFIPNERIEE